MVLLFAGVAALAAQQGVEAEKPVVRILDLQLRDLGASEELTVVADASLSWTHTHDGNGTLLIELPESRVSTGLAAPAGSRMASKIGVESAGTGTRIRLDLDADVDFEVFDGERELTVRMQRSSSLAAAEPAAAEDSVPRVVQRDKVAQRGDGPEYGTPEQPFVMPATSVETAQRLLDVEWVQTPGGTRLRLVADGELGYEAFLVDEPMRFVLDLPGVIKSTDTASLAVGSDTVSGVRMAQYRSQPEPITRVVFDLGPDATAPVLERSGMELAVSFGTQPPAVAVATVAIDEEPALERVVADSRRVATPDPAAVIADRVAPAAVGEQEGEGAVTLTATEPAAVPEAATVAFAEPETESPAIGRTTVPASNPERQVVATFDPPPIQPPPLQLPPSEAALPETRGRALAQQGQEPEVPEITVTAAQERAVVTPTSLTPQKVYFGEPVSMSLKDAEISEVLRSIAKIADLNIVIQPGVSGPVTVELTNVPWDQALEQVLKINNLGMELEGNILRIAPTSQLAREAQDQIELAQAQSLSIPLTTVMRRISYASANDVARILAAGGNSILSSRGSVIVDSRTNTLIIKELPSFMPQVIQIIENLDVPEEQVMIEARIIETTKTFSRALGIQWGFDGVADAVHGNTTGLQFPNNIDASGGVNLLRGGQNGILSLGLGNVLNTFELDATLTAAENEGLVNVISAPKVATLNNERASIQSGLQIPVQTVANNTVTVQFVNATLRLDVTPHVTADGTVLMDINIQKREPQLALAVVGSTNAPIATREARTRVLVRDGGTTVIGGIYTVSNDDSEDRVPGLANVPIIKHLFKNRERRSSNEELLIFITPRVIKL